MDKLFYLIRKILPELFLPLNFSLIILFYGLIKKKKLFVVSSFALIYFSSTNLISESLLRFIENPWKSQNSLISKKQAIVVLSDGIISSTQNRGFVHEWNDPDRFLAVINLHKKTNQAYLFLPEVLTH